MASMHKPVRIAGGVFVGLLIALFSDASAVKTPAKRQQTRTPWEGKGVFERSGCVRCHSVYGKGGDGGPDLGDKKFYGTYVDLAASMWNHLPRMYERMREREYQFPSMSNEDMEHLLGYLSYLRYFGDRGNSRVGKKLLRSKKCVECHKFGGEGGDIGPDLCGKDEYLSSLALVRAMWNHGPKMAEYFEKHGMEWPSFKDDEFVDLVAGIRSFMRPNKVTRSSQNLGDPEVGAGLVKSKGCAHCHATNGEGGDIGPDFSDLDLGPSMIHMAGNMWNHAPKMWEAMRAESVPFPEFEETEIADVIAYMYQAQFEIAPGDSARGSKVARESCVLCHAIDGKGGKIGPDFAGLAQMDSPTDMIAAMWNHAPNMREKQIEKHSKWPALDGAKMADLFAYLQSATSSGETKH